jgi:hypothetical protein
MIRRTRRRPVLSLGLALVIALGLFAVQARRRQMFEAEVGLLIGEGAFAADGRPRPPGELRAFITQATLSESSLDALVKKHDLVKKLRAVSPEAAKARLRKLVEVNTWHNYFDGYRDGSDPPRTARGTIVVSAPDPALASALVRDMAQIVTDAQVEQAAGLGNARVEGLRLLAENAAGRAVDLEKQLLRARAEAADVQSPVAPNVLQQLATAVANAQASARQSEAALVDAQLRARATRNLGDLVHVVERGGAYWSSISSRARLARQIVLSLILAGLVTVLLVGVFDPSVLDEDDIQRAGLLPIGTVPSSWGQSSDTEV